MKFLFTMSLLLVTQMSYAVCTSLDGAALEDGEQAIFYLKQNPRKEIGPNYSCKKVSRVRTCQSGALSNHQPECIQEDSGGCVDNWITRLNDGAFIYTFCQDTESSILN